MTRRQRLTRILSSAPLCRRTGSHRRPETLHHARAARRSCETAELDKHVLPRRAHPLRVTGHGDQGGRSAEPKSRQEDNGMAQRRCPHGRKFESTGSRR
ncbi:hypothetical protein MRX96_022072, partial [Rhipicephalus microplus]